MASAVKTDALPTRDSLFHIFPEPDLRSKIISLSEIARRFAKWDDTLSISVHEWCKEISLMDVKDVSSVTSKIVELATSILVNPR